MKNEPNFTVDPKALFLGPYSENQAEFRKLLEFLLNDIVQWRRNYHPNKQRFIEPVDKEKIEWKKTTIQLERELDRLLGELKQSIPFHNPRFIGHMHSDLVLPSLLGYMAGQLYNQNNVVGESSPVTTEKELQFIQYLCEMIHYPPFEYNFSGGSSNKQVKKTSTGHLTSGGTTANIEALWTARNIKYFPISLKLLLESNEIANKKEWISIIEAFDKLKLPVQGKEKSFPDAAVSELFNLSTTSVLDLNTQIKCALAPFLDNSETKKEGVLSENAFIAELNKYSVRAIGVYGIHKIVKEKLNIELKVPSLVVPQSRHYSWEKAMDILGLGSNNIRYVKVDENFKIDIEDFKSVCESLPYIITAIAVLGTTEEGVVDPIHEIIKIREQSNKNGKGFGLHIDAAYGGYYSALFNNPEKKGDFYSSHELKTEFDKIDKWLDNSTLKDFKAIKEADSITIDPHKMGYVPYAAGVVLYKDNRVKTFIEKKAPYLASGGDDEYDPTKIYLGGSTLEGSRSGAAALACYLSAKVIPNNSSGYGRLMLETFQNARAFIDKMLNPNNTEDTDKELLQIEVHPLYDSLTNIVCYAVGVEDIKLSADDLNKLNTRLYEEMSAEKNKTLNDYKFIVSKTSLEYDSSINNPGYANQIDSFLNKFGIDEKLKNKDFKLVLLRSTLMNPMLSDEAREGIFNDYFDYLRRLVNKILPEVLLEGLIEANQFVRYKVLWIENQERIKKLKKAILKGGVKKNLDISRFLDIDFIAELDDNSLDTNDRKKDIAEYQIFIVDLNLADRFHQEWDSGIKVLKKIKEECNDPVILVYSQFLNKEFKLKNKKITSDPTQVKHSVIIGNYLKHYLGLTDDNLVPKTISDGIGHVSESRPVELKDLDLLTLKLAKILFKGVNQKIQ